MTEIQNQSKTVSFGEWIGTLLLMLIPVANIVLAFVWALGNSKPSKKNLFRAWLILLACCIVLGAAFWAFAAFALGWTYRIPDLSGLIMT